MFFEVGFLGVGSNKDSLVSVIWVLVIVTPQARVMGLTIAPPQQQALIHLPPANAFSGKGQFNLNFTCWEAISMTYTLAI